MNSVLGLLMSIGGVVALTLLFLGLADVLPFGSKEMIFWATMCILNFTGAWSKEK